MLYRVTSESTSLNYKTRSFLWPRIEARCGYIYPHLGRVIIIVNAVAILSFMVVT